MTEQLNKSNSVPMMQDRVGGVERFSQRFFREDVAEAESGGRGSEEAGWGAGDTLRPLSIPATCVIWRPRSLGSIAPPALYSLRGGRNDRGLQA